MFEKLRKVYFVWTEIVKILPVSKQREPKCLCYDKCAQEFLITFLPSETLAKPPTWHSAFCMRNITRLVADKWMFENNTTLWYCKYGNLSLVLSFKER